MTEVLTPSFSAWAMTSGANGLRINSRCFVTNSDSSQEAIS
ncbi:hypothetical protein [Limnospira fusiformis]